MQQRLGVIPLDYAAKEADVHNVKFANVLLWKRFEAILGCECNVWQSKLSSWVLLRRVVEAVKLCWFFDLLGQLLKPDANEIVQQVTATAFA